MSENNELPLVDLETKAQEIKLSADGIYAVKTETGLININKADGSLLFSVQAERIAFEQSILLYLLQTYALGFQKGRVIGMQVLAQKIHMLIGGNLA
jgi:hypothetical protein